MVVLSQFKLKMISLLLAKLIVSIQIPMHWNLSCLDTRPLVNKIPRTDSVHFPYSSTTDIWRRPAGCPSTTSYTEFCQKENYCVKWPDRSGRPFSLFSATFKVCRFLKATSRLVGICWIRFPCISSCCNATFPVWFPVGRVVTKKKSSSDTLKQCDTLLRKVRWNV